MQYFQLLKGGYHRKLQTTSLRLALREIERNKLIEHQDCADLLNAVYSFPSVRKPYSIPGR
ncbi:MAG: hypothetical protein CM15mP58_05520 [Burkholderiaceae bacterium]|nr:MAG: hypothetical protein CM15mP58_05520 [Burkholderiaceae bacterium]